MPIPTVPCFFKTFTARSVNELAEVAIREADREAMEFINQHRLILSDVKIVRTVYKERDNHRPTVYTTVWYHAYKEVS